MDMGALLGQVAGAGGQTQMQNGGDQFSQMMLAFMRSGIHLKAMKAFHSIATGRTYGYESDAIPMGV